MGRELLLGRPPRRIVSLVPSETESLFALGVGDRVVGRTTYCVEPAAEVASIPTVGGTKDVDVDAVCDLEPDLILANQEENARGPLQELASRRMPMFVSFPARVADGVAHTARIARLAGIEREPAVAEAVAIAYRAVAAAEARVAPGGDLAALPVFVPIWLDPLMTISRDTFGSDMLRLAGAENTFADRTRKYPLKADLGLRSPLAADRAANRDIRYPRITEAELIERQPAVLLLPDEPYAFTEAEGRELAALDFATPPRWRHVSGKDLFWYGTRIPAALERLTAIIDQLRH